MTEFVRAVARRYLKSTRKDAYVSFLSRAAAIGIGLGSGALILALAALSGFQETLKAEIFARTPMLEVELAPGVDAIDARDRLAAAGLDASRVIRGRGWLIGNGRLRPVEVVGAEGDLPVWFPAATSRRPGIYLGSRLAESWGLAAGDAIEVASNRPALTPLGPQPLVRRGRLAGTYESGKTDELDLVALPYAEAVGLLGADRVRLHVRTETLAAAVEAAPRVAAVLGAGAAEVRTWQDLNRALLFALRLEKTVMFVAVFLIVIVAALSLLSGLMLLVTSKRREIGMLGAMGAAPRTIRGVFLWLAGMLATLGLAGGAAVGVGTAWAADRFRLVPLPDQVYFVDHVPFIVRPADLALVLGASLVVLLICAWSAGRSAAELDPVEALRR